ncbi:polysaccharide deacetylase family protein [Mucilaginibacter sp. SG564]|uniref:polysaccharide deacetylase family protein n=1 Tax=Mucilaginibacter sp. SG564 TaxID=2587022 RepID=UPI0015529BCE|nr:polysaccharide deacetylase family protein [Mucilaginibacter sp. SG564]NOW95642.1 peptidoglycan/xylan/chitin deacetylase (PgdA/CDA1 family) [Mucilaginibacter sp. SG564]
MLLKPLFLLLASGIIACQSNSTHKAAVVLQPAAKPAVSTGTPPVDTAAIMKRKQIPVLCYHQIRDWRSTDSKSAKDDIVQIAAFKEHIKMLADQGYHSILPDQLYDYLTTGAPLPSKPIMFTFDDTDLDQFTIAAPELKKYGFKAVYFIMTVSIGRPHYMTKAQIKQLSDEGNIIGSHTWDHHPFTKLSGKDWEIQLDKPTKKLEEITGKPVKYFAYPFGLWDKKGLPELHKRGFKAAFQLSTKRYPGDPLMTIRRIIDSGHWNAKNLMGNINRDF